MFERLSARRRRLGSGRGFTIIEISVVLAVLGILILLIEARYAGSRERAFNAEADHVLHELKGLAWAYYQQYGTWSGITPANFATALRFTGPDDGIACWDYVLPGDASATEIIFRANGDNTPTKCGPVNGKTRTLTFTSDGTAALTSP